MRKTGGLELASTIILVLQAHWLLQANRPIGLLRKFQPVLPRSSLLTIYKTFIPSLFENADVVYNQSYKSPFQEKLESIQYNAALAVISAIRGSSFEKLYQELGLEYLQNRRWFRKLFQFYKNLKNISSRYRFNIISTKGYPN